MKQNRKLPVLLATMMVLVLLMTSTASAVSYHTVAPGDWLSKIAPTYDMTWQELYDANRTLISNPDLIYPGQKLMIPDKGTAQPTAVPMPDELTIALAKLAALVPKDEVAGIPAVLVSDSALVDSLLMSLKTAAKTDLASLPVPMGIGMENYAGVLKLFQADSLATISVTGKELKALLEGAASGYATWVPGDVTIAFNAASSKTVICQYAGISYAIDLSQPAGKRIVNATFDGKAIADDQVLTLAAPLATATAWKKAGLFAAAPVAQMADQSLAAILATNLPADTSKMAADKNWSLIGINLNNPLRAEILAMVKAGTLKLEASADGKIPAVKALNAYTLISTGAMADYTIIDMFHINDTHGRIKAGDGMGFAKIDTLVKAYKAKNANALLLDIGDTFHGVNFVTLTQGESAVNVMNAMKFDAMAPGNHDFNYGQDRLLALDALTSFPILAANVIKADGTPYLTPYVIKTVDGVRIALIGLATPETVYKTNPNNVTGLTFEDPIVATKRVLAELDGKADVFVALAHLGIEGEDTSRALAQAVPELDVILDGHSHSVLNEVVNGVLLSQTGYYDKGLGITSLVMKDGALVKTSSTLYAMTDAVNTVESSVVKAIVTAADEKVSALTSAVIGTSPMLLDGVRNNVRSRPTNLANLITAAMLDKTGADVAITNGGGIRASIEAGEVTKGDVLTVLPFGNYVVVKELKGSDILAALELGFSTYPEPLGGYSQTAGLTIRVDTSKPKGSRVLSVTVAGVALDPAKTYKVATNDFMAVGGDNYTMLKNGPTVGEYPALDEIVIEYIQADGFGAAVEDARVTDEAPPAPAEAPAAYVELEPAA